MLTSAVMRVSVTPEILSEGVTMARRWTLALVAACAARAGAHNATRGHSHGRSGHEHNGHGHGARAGEPRVRREIRTLPSAEFDALVGAMWTMKTLDDAAGKARFGPHFRTYDSFVAQHVAASLGTRCDEAHFSPVFAVWHRAYLYEFELSLAAVDANVSSLPYWDYRPDAADPGRPEGALSWRKCFMIQGSTGSPCRGAKSTFFEITIFQSDRRGNQTVDYVTLNQCYF